MACTALGEDLSRLCCISGRRAMSARQCSPLGQASTSTWGLHWPSDVLFCHLTSRCKSHRAFTSQRNQVLSCFNPCSKEDFIKASGHIHTGQRSSAERLGSVLSSQHHSWSRVTTHCYSWGCTDELAHTTPSPKPSSAGLAKFNTRPSFPITWSTEFTLLLMKQPLWE